MLIEILFVFWVNTLICFGIAMASGCLAELYSEMKRAFFVE